MIIPKNAQTAMLMARYLTRSVIHAIDGKVIKPFTYHSKGSILTLGPTGIFDLPHLPIRTPLATIVRDIFYRYRWTQVVGR
jgi:NADH dehydrogenase FAD-containing subunit